MGDLASRLNTGKIGLGGVIRSEGIPRTRQGAAQPASNTFGAHLEDALARSSTKRLEQRVEAASRKAALNTDGAMQKMSLEEQRRQLWDAALQLEALFVQQVVSAMQRTVPRGEGVLDESKAEEIFRGMLDEEWAKIMADSGETGLARMLYEQLSQSLVESEKDKATG